MKKRVLFTNPYIFIIPIIFLWLTSCATPTIGRGGLPTLPPTSEATPMRILTLGDSYTIGESVPPQDRWPQQLAAQLNANGIPAAAPHVIAQTGWTTAELQTAIDQAQTRGTLTPPYDLVTLLIGVNNQYRGYPQGEYAADFESLLQQAITFAGEQPGRVIVISIPDWGVMPFATGRDTTTIAAQIDSFNQIAEGIAEKYGVHYINITPISRQAPHNPALIAPDGLHPSGEQYRLWVEQIYPLAEMILR